MKTESKIYCTFCGEENNKEDLACKKCHRFLKRKDHPLIDYMEDKIKDEFTGGVKNTAFSIINNYIKSHLYGFVLTLSIIASTTTVIVNNRIQNDEVNYVREKLTPTIASITYQGEGLSSYELAKKYVDAMESGNIDTVRGLQLDNFYPELLERIKTYQDQNKLDIWDSPATTHHLFDNRDIYFKMNETISAEGVEHYYLGDSELIREHREYLGYQTDDYMLGLWYCNNHTCSTSIYDGRTHSDFSPNIQIQVISVEGKYYILGEKVTIYMGQNEEVYHMALFRSKGDTTNLNFDEALKEYDSCGDYNGYDQACLDQHGFTLKGIRE